MVVIMVFGAEMVEVIAGGTEVKEVKKPQVMETVTN